jgi:SAM-dependent methyltransferase
MCKKYGVDIAVRRHDDLDKKAIAYVDEYISAAKKVSVVDIGCGAGGVSAALAQPGAVVLGIDIVDHSAQFQQLREKRKLSHQQLDFIQGDIRNLQSIVVDAYPQVCLMQRTIHYLPYNDALLVLLMLKNSGVQRLFISVSGLESDIGRVYKDANVPIQKRFCRLTKDEASIFSITQPLCLYTPEEFINLLQSSGWQIEECWVSAFGNIKAVCKIT